MRGNHDLFCSPMWFDKFHILFDKLWANMSSRSLLNATSVRCLSQLEFKLVSLEALTYA